MQTDESTITLFLLSKNRGGILHGGSKFYKTKARRKYPVYRRRKLTTGGERLYKGGGAIQEELNRARHKRLQSIKPDAN